MTQPTGLAVYLEIGQKRAFAGALDWPGWCRAARGEEAALQALVDYAPRYARLLDGTGLGFRPPQRVSELVVTERLAGNTTTDFGAPDAAPAQDARPFTDADLARCRAILEACWRALDDAVDAAAGRELRRGPRGGGRDLEGVLRHVLGAEQGYLVSRTRTRLSLDGGSLSDQLAHTRRAVLDALAVAARGEEPQPGPRGGRVWPAHYFVRRVAWHVLDHVWEIEDRAELAR